jgi:hypothetical protein
MSRWKIILLAVLALPYGYLLLEWSACFAGACQLDGHKIFYTLVALVALPFVLAIMGGVLAVGGARRVVSAVATGGGEAERIVDSARGGVRLWIGIALLVAMLPACMAILGIALYTPEPGRDRLGRMCEKSGGATVCRPDPDANHPTEIEMLNRHRKRQRSAD